MRFLIAIAILIVVGGCSIPCDDSYFVYRERTSWTHVYTGNFIVTNKCRKVALVTIDLDEAFSVRDRLNKAVEVE